ncbi:MAG: sensor histidine kinase [Deltaproteobacteria bacterium]|nr:MAG: sensor histidine kinase [Deltaproteobacteria bacterium]
MRIGARALLVMVPVAVLPLIGAGWIAFKVSRRALEDRTRAAQVAAARSLAERVSAEVSASLHAAGLAGNAMDFAELSAGERVGALRLVFRQIEGAAAVALLSPDGAQVASPVYLDSRAQDPSLADRAILGEQDIDEFARSIPLRAAVQVGAAVGPAHASRSGEPRVAVAVRARGGLVLAVEFSLARLIPVVSESRLGVRGSAVVVDRTGRVVLGSIAPRSSLSGSPLVQAALAGSLGALSFIGPDGVERLGATAEAPDLGWIIAIDEPAEDALAESRVLARRTAAAVAIALVAGVALALLASRAIVRPIRALHQGAAALAGGELGHRVVAADRGDELGDLARAFNTMAAEIERWNRELAQRVEEKTREAREAQDLLLRAQKLAAVGQLGAGVAHEVNNPLAGLLGQTQLLLLQEPADSARRKKLASIETQALRIREIVQRLQQGAEGAEQTAVDLRALLDDSLARNGDALASAKVQIVREYGPPLRITGDPRRLTEAFAELVTNARRAMPAGGQLTVGYRCIDGQLAAIRFADTGEGISPSVRPRIFEPFFTTKKDWNAKGLGLTMVHQVCEEHNGRVTVESAPGKGATFTVVLPVLQERALA